MRRATSESSSKQTSFKKDIGMDDDSNKNIHTPSKDVELKRMVMLSKQSSLQRQRSSYNSINTFEKMVFGILIAFISVFVLCSLLYLERHLPKNLNTGNRMGGELSPSLELLSNIKELNENSVTLVKLMTTQEDLNLNMKKLIGLMEKEREYNKVRNIYII